MSFPGKDRQIKMYLSGGLCDQRINDAIPPGDALVCLNVDSSRAKRGGIMKRGDKNRVISGSGIPDDHHVRHLINFGLDAKEESGEGWMNVEPLCIAGNPNEADFLYSKLFRAKLDNQGNYLWSLRNLPPSVPWGGEGGGIDFFAAGFPHSVLRNPRKYLHQPEDTNRSLEYRYFYLFRGKTGSDTAYKAAILLFYRKIAQYDFGTYMLVPLFMPNIHHNVITLTNEKIGGTGPGPYGWVSYHFLQEDISGNVGSFLEEWKDTRVDYQFHVEPKDPTQDNVVRIKIDIPLQVMPGLKNIHIFRTPRRSEGEGKYQDGMDTVNYFHIKTIDVMKTENPQITYDDPMLAYDVRLLNNDVMEAFFNASLPPEELRIDPINRISVGAIHQGRLYIADGNTIRWSLENFHRNFVEGDLLELPEVDRIVALHSGYNRLEIFAEDSVWVWYGRSGAEMDATRPKRIWNQGLPFRDVHWGSVRGHNTIRGWGQRTLFVDKNRFPRQLVGEDILHLSSDGIEKVRIPLIINRNDVEAIVVDNQYRITNGDRVYVCELDKDYAWREWDLKVDRFMYPNIPETQVSIDSETGIPVEDLIS